MTSNINPNNIDGAYPVAGQDNNSQGFRTNFTNTSTNFQFAADEITDLQNNAVLKSALAGTTLDNDMQGSPLSNAVLSNMSEAVNVLGPVSGTVTIDYTLGSVQTLTTNGSVSFQFINFPASGVAAGVTLTITISNTSHILQFPSSVSFNRNIQGFNGTNNTMTFAYAGTYNLQFDTLNGGASISINQDNSRLNPFNNSDQLLTDTGVANLAVTTSYFTTVAPSTATLPAGVSGQVKVFSMYGASGNMVVTVSNAGWKSSGTGTMTFSAIGQSCTLRYTNNKWFCIGNNGTVFA
jgi:hypothetical protein